MTDDRLTRATPILDYRHPAIEALVRERGWEELAEPTRIGAVYTFVKDEIPFAYNTSDDLPASHVLRDGYGQCNTKSTLFMALLRRLGIPCRLHGFTIHNELQQGAIPSWLISIAPPKILHSWVEVEHDGRWLSLEGLILDGLYLQAVQTRFRNTEGSFSGYAVATPNLADPGVEWQGKSTYIQRQGIADDLGVYDDPDTFYQRHGTNLRGPKRWLYAHLLRYLINRNVERVRRPPASTKRAVSVRHEAV